MCVVSMVMDHQYDEWRRRTGPTIPNPVASPPWRIVPSQHPLVPLVTQDEVDEFRRLFERAREYDRRHNQPDCELEEKRERVRQLARELGVEVAFV